MVSEFFHTALFWPPSSYVAVNYTNRVTKQRTAVEQSSLLLMGKRISKSSFWGKSELGTAFHPKKVALINVISAFKGLFSWRWGTPGS